MKSGGPCPAASPPDGEARKRSAQRGEAERRRRPAASPPDGEAKPELGEQGLVRFHGIRVGGCMLAEQALLHQEPLHAPRDACGDAGHFFVARRWQGGEVRRLVGHRRDVHSVEDERMIMWVQVDRSAAALQEAHGAAMQAGAGECPSRSPPERCENGAYEDAQHLAAERLIEGKARAQGEGQGQHVLAYRNLGEDAVDQVRCGVGHAARSA